MRSTALLTMHPSLFENVRHHEDQHPRISPRYLPMLVPPEPWRGDRFFGAYFFHKAPLMKVGASTTRRVGNLFMCILSHEFFCICVCYADHWKLPGGSSAERRSAACIRWPQLPRHDTVGGGSDCLPDRMERVPSRRSDFGRNSVRTALAAALAAVLYADASRNSAAAGRSQSYF